VKIKSTNLSKILIPIVLIFMISLIAMLVFDNEQFSNSEHQSVQAAPSTAVTLYLPFTINRFPLQTAFGIETNPTEKGFSSIVALKSSWIRYNSLRWSLVEPNKGDRDWSTMADLEASLLHAAQNGIEPILIVRSTPAWAQTIIGATCGPIKSEELAAFGQFYILLSCATPATLQCKILGNLE
jgi:hypothetical protein